MPRKGAIEPAEPQAQDVPGEVELHLPGAPHERPAPENALQHLAAAGAIQQQVVGPICQYMDSIVVSFNEILNAGLGEVPAKYDISFPDWFDNFSIQVNGRNFPKKKLSSNGIIDDFKLTMVELRGLSLKSASYIIRDVTRFLGCFEFTDEAGRDLPNLVVSIFRRGYLKKLLVHPLWNAKNSYLRSLQFSLKHFVEYLENEQRVDRAFGGLTTALGCICRAFGYEMGARMKHTEALRKATKVDKDAVAIHNWVGAEVWKELVVDAHLVLKYIWSHKDDPGFWTKDIHLLALQCVVIIIFLDCYSGRSGGWELILTEDMVEQLAGELAASNVLLFKRHKTMKVCGFGIPSPGTLNDAPRNPKLCFQEPNSGVPLKLANRGPNLTKFDRNIVRPR